MINGSHSPSKLWRLLRRPDLTTRTRKANKSSKSYIYIYIYMIRRQCRIVQLFETSSKSTYHDQVYTDLYIRFSGRSAKHGPSSIAIQRLPSFPGNQRRGRRLGALGWLVGFLTSSSTTRLYRGRAPRQERLTIFYVLPHMRQSWETMTSVSAGHIIQTPTQPVGSGRPQRESNPGPPHQESRALPQSYRPPPPPPG